MGECGKNDERGSWEEGYGEHCTDDTGGDEQPEKAPDEVVSWWAHFPKRRFQKEGFSSDFAGG